MSQVATQGSVTANAGKATAAPRIRVRGLGKHYGSLEVFRNIDFEVGEREIVAIVGPSGCGRTTRLHGPDHRRPRHGCERRGGGKVWPDQTEERDRPRAHRRRGG